MSALKPSPKELRRLFNALARGKPKVRPNFRALAAINNAPAKPQPDELAPHEVSAEQALLHRVETALDEAQKATP